ncbi:hypothetical protein PT974_04519 [Cladobotryum mycophilum]|uniref:Bacteriophage T5 Orf172 DNA-binding domain-containing protein n=1 Tax=Cladobotryum mycophilum TaxID=491253 RepID=A0ABR0SW15_9HYPO
MPFIPNTPESLLARTDSKKADSTCRGITSNGRPCRRPITAPFPAPGDKQHLSAAAAADDLSDESLYCWQHKEQARAHSAHSTLRPQRPHMISEEGRSSLDTLADRLGLLELQEQTHATSANGYSNGGQNQYPKPEKRPSSTKRKKRSLTFCFCFSIPVEESHQQPRPHRPRPQAQPSQAPSAPIPTTFSARPPASHHSAVSSAAGPKPLLIPDSLPAAAASASALRTEVARPVTESDEPGYIYMFWLTPVSASTPAPIDAARSLLVPPSRPDTSRRASDVVSSFADQHSKKDSKTMLLKIGRAANVQRRMNQWSRQCGYSIEMLRFYPYVPSSSTTPSPSTSPAHSPAPRSRSNSSTPHTTPHVKKVERLIHLELSGLGLRAKLGTCEACGREHKEWFEVEASREGIKAVDDIIRRWIEWDESSG